MCNKNKKFSLFTSEIKIEILLKKKNNNKLSCQINLKKGR